MLCGLYFARDFFIPVSLAFFIAAVSFPITNWLREHKVPRFLSVMITVLVVVAFLSGVMVVAFLLINDLAEGSRLEDYGKKMYEVAMNGGAQLEEWQFEGAQEEIKKFLTAEKIGDFFKEEKYFGAEQIIVLSASSKTALGTAFCLKRAGGARVVGLTSDKNIEFVKSTGYYDEVISYDAISSLSSAPKTALIDMAGNGKINGNLYRHFGANIIYNCMVGKSHWQGDRPPKIEAGAPPAMFFAPDRAKKRIADWGGAGFAKNLGESWMPFCVDAKEWMSIKTYSGEQDLLEHYRALLAGQVDPSLGQLFTL